MTTPNEQLEDFRSEKGFSLIQLLITASLIVVISTFAMLSIGTARASMRLSGATRELAGYLEKARSNAIRRNGTATVNIASATSYTVTMDFDGDGTTETQTINLTNGVTFATGSVGISTVFDWRGRIPNQVGIGLQNENGQTNSINISGSGDVTLGDEIFQDSAIGVININNNLSSTVAQPTPTPLPSPGSTPSPSPSPSPTPYPSPSVSPTPVPSPTAAPSPGPSPSPSTSPSPSPSPSVSPSPSPSPLVCSISAPASVTFPKNGSPRTISVSVTNAISATLVATKTGDISSVSPATTTVSGNGTVPYTVTYPNGNQSGGTVTISSVCGNKTVDITIN